MKKGSISSVFKNMISQYIGKFFTSIASFLVVIILTKFGVENYGKYVLSYEFLAFFGVFADAGLFAIGVRELAQKKQKAVPIFQNIFSIRLLLIFITIIFAGLFANFFTDYSEIVKNGIWITGISMGLTILAGTLSIPLQAKMKIHFFSFGLVISKLILLGSLFLFWMSHSSTSLTNNEFYNLLWFGVLGNLVFSIIVWVFSRKNIQLGCRFDKNIWKKIFRESLPYGLSLVIQTLYLRIDIIIISVLLTTADTGIYGLGTRLIESLLVLGVFFSQSMLPKIAESEHAVDRFQKLFNVGVRFIALFSIPFILFFNLFSREIISLISSNEFLSTITKIGSDTIITGLVFIVPLAFLNQFFTTILITKKKQIHLLKINSAALCTNVVLNFLFIPKYGLIAAVYSTIISEIIVCVWIAVIIKKYVRFQFANTLFYKIIGLHVFVFCLIYLTSIKENFTIAAVLYGFAYLLFAWRYRHKLFLREW